MVEEFILPFVPRIDLPVDSTSFNSSTDSGGVWQIDTRRSLRVRYQLKGRR
jgi:hypothetical protein